MEMSIMRLSLVRVVRSVRVGGVCVRAWAEVRLRNACRRGMLVGGRAALGCRRGMGWRRRGAVVGICELPELVWGSGSECRRGHAGVLCMCLNEASPRWLW